MLLVVRLLRGQRQRLLRLRRDPRKLDRHVARLCSTAGGTSAELTPQAADAYYLIVPRNPSFEGAYGKASSGADIPQGGSACVMQQVATVCP